MVTISSQRKMQRFRRVTVFCVCFLFYGAVLSQTPPGYAPFTMNRLEVAFAKGHALEHAGFLQPEDAEQSPVIGRENLNIFEKYIIFMMDIQVIHPPVAYPLLHWYQPDLRVVQSRADMYILGNRSAGGAHYVGPQPIPGPRHTYVLLLFRQPSNFKFPKCFDSIFPISVKTRAGFDLHRFMTIAGLEDPIAANYFTSEASQKPSGPLGRVTTTSLSHAPCATASSQT